MKHLMVLVTALLSLSLCACTDSENIAFLEENTNPSLEISVDPAWIDVANIPDFIKITVTNTSETQTYKGGEHYAIARWNGENWVRIHTPGVADESLPIPPSERVEFEYIQLGMAKYRFKTGKYAVIFNNRCYGEFSIIEPTISGVWETSGTVSILGENTPDPTEITEIWTFNEDGTATVEVITPETTLPAAEFTYTLKNDILTLTANEHSTEYSCTLDAETMTWNDTLVFTRIE